jgi:hypothetical protein
LKEALVEEWIALRIWVLVMSIKDEFILRLDVLRANAEVVDLKHRVL